MKFAVVGGGATGLRAARQLGATAGTEAEVVTRDQVVPSGVDAVILCTPASQADLAEGFLREGIPVVTTTDDRSDVQRCFELGTLAANHDVPIIIGAGFAPGLTDLLARFAASRLQQVDEIHVAKHGTGGPACARQHHQALASAGQVWRDGRWLPRVGGSGRELCWFPDPVGALDCYNGDLADARLLLESFQGAQRVSARMSATRRDRMTSRLPMLRKPHPEGGIGAIRVEVRGIRDGERISIVFGAIDRPAIAAGTVAAVAALHLAAPRAFTGPVVLGDERIDTLALLKDLAERGVRAAEFAGQGNA